MSTFNVGVWITTSQYDDTGWEVRDTVVNYLENCTGNTNHSISAVAKDSITAPEECVYDDFTTDYPCDGQIYDSSYSNLLEWWVDYTNNCDLNLESDSNLLVSNCEGCGAGGLAEVTGSRAVSNGACIEDLPNSWIEYSNQSGAGPMGIALQEVGHNIMKGVNDDDDDGQKQHDTADTWWHYGDWYITPMGKSYYNDIKPTNECDQNIDAPTDDDSYIQFEYDDCAGDKMG